MEEIFKLYNQTLDPNFIGQDKLSREIIEKSSNFLIYQKMLRVLNMIKKNKPLIII
jgi:hypothetical protein